MTRHFSPIVFAAALALAGCNNSSNTPQQSNAAPPAPAPQQASKPVKDTITIAQSADAYTMDPAKHSTFPTANILFHIFDALVTQDETGKFKPALAESWSNPDPNTWQFRLRQNVKFHNGEEFDADAVKFTFDRALDPAFKAPYYSRISAIKSVEIVDKYTVNFKTAAPFPTMLYSLGEASFAALIVPPKYVRENPDALQSKPVGTGPYKFVEWAKDDHVAMEANPDYWGGAPKVKKIIWRPIAEVRTRIAELRSGGVDVAGDIPPEDVAGLNSGSTKVITAPSDFLFFFVFDTLKSGPLQDKRVRQALNHAVDADAIQKAILGSIGNRIALTLPTNAFGYDKSWQPYVYDPDKAKKLLAEAGYPDGFTIPLVTRQGRYLKDKEIVEATIGYLAKVGVKVEPKYLEPGVWAQVSERKGRDGISYPGWSGLDPDLVWYPILYSGQYQSYYSNKDLDALLDKARQTLDEKERLDAYGKAAAIIKEEAPHIPMFQPSLIYATNSSLQWIPRGDSIIDLRKAEFR